MSDQEYFRPTDWDDYQGQTLLKETLDIQIRSALARGTALDHVMLAGPPGCGKTTIAQIIAERMDMDFGSWLMPVKDYLLKGIFAGLENTVVFFDEFHRCKPAQQEELLTVIEDGYYQTPSGAVIELDNITVIAATTERDDVIEPLWDRFQIKPVFTPYTTEDMTNVILGMANNGAGLNMEPDEAFEFAKATRGVPRAAKKIVGMYRDLFVGSGYSRRPSVDEVLEQCRLTRDGWSSDHMSYLQTLKKVGGQAGIDALEIHSGVPKAVLKRIERELINEGIIAFTKQGRELLSGGYKIVKEGASWA